MVGGMEEKNWSKRWDDVLHLHGVLTVVAIFLFLIAALLMCSGIGMFSLDSAELHWPNPPNGSLVVPLIGIAVFLCRMDWKGR
jgi:hypothetical protein